jgi:hypothetical protein
VIIGDFFWISFFFFQQGICDKILFTKWQKFAKKLSLVNESFYATLNLDSK